MYCALWQALCTVHCTLCTLHSEKHCALRNVHYALWKALCTVKSTLHCGWCGNQSSSNSFSSTEPPIVWSDDNIVHIRCILGAYYGAYLGAYSSSTQPPSVQNSLLCTLYSAVMMSSNFTMHLHRAYGIYCPHGAYYAYAAYTLSPIQPKERLFDFHLCNRTLHCALNSTYCALMFTHVQVCISQGALISTHVQLWTL